MPADGIGLHRHLFHLGQAGRGRDLIDRALQLPTHRIPRGQGKQLRLIRLDELLQDATRGGEFHIEQRRGLLAGGQQDELPIGPVRVQVDRIIQLIPDFRRIAGNVDVEIGKGGGLARQQRPVFLGHDGVRAGVACQHAVERGMGRAIGGQQRQVQEQRPPRAPVEMGEQVLPESVLVPRGDQRYPAKGIGVEPAFRMRHRVPVIGGAAHHWQQPG